MSLTKNRLMEKVPCNKYHSFFILFSGNNWLDGALDVSDTYYMGRETLENLQQKFPNTQKLVDRNTRLALYMSQRCKLAL